MYLASTVGMLIILWGSYLLYFNRFPVLRGLAFVLFPYAASLAIQSTVTHSFLLTLHEQKKNFYIFMLVMIILYIFLRAISTNRLGQYLFTLFAIVATAGNVIKYTTRNEVVLWNDFTGGLLKEVVWDMVLKEHFILVTLALILLIVLGIFIARSEDIKISWKSRSIQLVLTCVLGFFILRQPATLFKHLGGYIFTDNIQDNVKVNGPGLSFILSKEGIIMEEPAGYSKSKMTAIVKKLKNQYQSKEKAKPKDRPTVIFVLSEALSDPTKFSDTKWEQDPLPTIHQLQKESGGYMFSHVFGGGTADTEYSILTNFSYDLLNSYSTPYLYISNSNEKHYSFIANFKKLGYEAVAFHPYLAKSYSRDKVFEKLGFDRFDTQTELKKTKANDVFYSEGYISDISFFNGLYREIDEQPQFLHGISMQNHYPYTNAKKGALKSGQSLLVNQDQIKGGEQLALYTRGVNETDQALKNFVNKLKKLDKEVYLVMYGDHYPALDNKVYKNNKIATVKDQTLAQHLTPYFVWNNKGKKVTMPKYANPEFLTANMMEQTGIPLPIFEHFLVDLSKHMSAFDVQISKYYQDGKWQNKLDKKTKAMLEDYRLIMYDMLSGKGYAKDLFKEK